MFLKKVGFEKGDGNWINILATILKQYNNRNPSSTKLTPIRSICKKNEGFVYHKLVDKRKKVKPKFQLNDLLRTTGLRKSFPKGETTICSNQLHEITENVNVVMILYQVTKTIIYRGDIMKCCWKRQKYQWKKIRML